MEASRLKHRQWSKDSYIISIDPNLIPIQRLNDAFASKDFYWALPMPIEALKEMLQNSLCFGLYAQPPTSDTSMSTKADPTPSQKEDFIGFARCITDFTTFIYLTDVYVWPTHQGKGLGKWLVGCVQEVVESMPYLRRSLCFTSDWERSVPFYEKVMGMEVVESGRGETGTGGKGVAVLIRLGDGSPAKVGEVLEGVGGSDSKSS